MRSDGKDHLNFLERELQHSYKKVNEAQLVQREHEKDRLSLQADNDSYRSQIVELQNLSKSHETKIQALEQEVSELRQVARIRDAMLAEATRQASNMAAVVEQLKDKLYAETLNAASTAKRQIVLKEQVKGEQLLRQHLTECAAVSSRLAEQHRALSEKNIELVKEKNQLQQDLRELREKLIEDGQPQHDRFISDLQRLQERWDNRHVHPNENKGEVESLWETISQLEQVLQRKNQVLARLDQQIYSEKKKLPIAQNADMPLADQVVSLENTVYFLTQEIENNNKMVNELREKHAELLLMESALREEANKDLAKQQQLNQRNAQLVKQIRELEAIRQREAEQLSHQKKKSSDEKQLRKNIQKQMLDILIENEALQKLAYERIGPEFKREKDANVEKIIARQGINYVVSTYNKYATIEELIELNHRLIAQLMIRNE